MPIQPWTVLRSRVLLERWWLKLREDRVRLGNGAEIEEFHVMEYPDWTSVLCETDEGDYVVVRQYRHGIGRVVIELPAGGVHPGEDPLVAAKRELLEETGYVADDWRLLARCATEPARHTNYAHLYHASGARRVAAPRPDYTEDLAIERLTRDDLLAALHDGRFVHGVQTATFFFAREAGLI